MNAAGLRCCIEDKEAMAAAYNDLSTKSTKECALYERDLERAMESYDNLARENDELRARLHQNADLAALTAQVQELQKEKEMLRMNLDTAEREVITLSEDNRVLDKRTKDCWRKSDSADLKESNLPVPPPSISASRQV